MMNRALIIVLLFAATVIAEPKAVWRDRLEVTGVSTADALRVVVVSGDASTIAKRPAIVGDWKSFGKEAFAFVPKYPLVPGGNYRVYFDADTKFADVALPDLRDKTPPVLKQIFPSSDTIPENTLRFYLVFSKSMSRGEAYTRVKILDEKGKAVDQPFLELEEELWDADQKRLTLLIDPGRIKQEVKPRLDLGPVFQAGKKFTIVVDGRWPDSTGAVLGNDWRRQITAGEPRAVAPTPKDWKVAAPSESKSPLSITFPVSMDESLLQRTLTVLDNAGSEILGKVVVEKNETVWKFVPIQPWKAGRFAIRLDWKLEDVSGNAIERPFESEETPVGKKIVPTKSSLIPFEFSPKS